MARCLLLGPVAIIFSITTARSLCSVADPLRVLTPSDIVAWRRTVSLERSAVVLLWYIDASSSLIATWQYHCLSCRVCVLRVTGGTSSRLLIAGAVVSAEASIVPPP